MKTLKIIIGVIIDSLTIPIITATIFYWYWKWNGFLLNFFFDTSGLEREELMFAKLGLMLIGLLILVCGCIPLFPDDKKEADK